MLQIAQPQIYFRYHLLQVTKTENATESFRGMALFRRPNEGFSGAASVGPSETQYYHRRGLALLQKDDLWRRVNKLTCPFYFTDRVEKAWILADVR